MRLSAASILLLAPLVRCQIAPAAGGAQAAPAPAAPAPIAGPQAGGGGGGPGQAQPAAPGGAQAPAQAPAPAPIQGGGQLAPAPAAPNPNAPAQAAPAPAPVPPAAGNPALGGGAVPATTQLGQVPPVTAANIPITLANGQISNVQTVFTQTFAEVPSQLPGFTSGSVGLGTLTGSVGAVRTDQAKGAEGGVGKTACNVGVMAAAGLGVAWVVV
ncbi:MAG: hypothetical protein M1817_005956 [Caeruleum heppii]|nr:MAG: hypothetical protein M1817_005956 [Caeruleum heppii]